MAHALYRLREFVTANMDADLGSTPQRVQRTLHEVNQFLGFAFIHLASDSPSWWRDFCAAEHRISLSSTSWAVALCAIPPPSDSAAPASDPAVATGQQHQVCREPGPRGAQPRPSGFPANIRGLIPRNTDGQEPCLRFFAGSM
ncbi:hypothetical protein PF008_g13992 [Phytophthora fragariae]|uniref:Uncharacterized protein n=1 Tax=Phytophthora fragariae TaxID=53985 RepID=A0A6G0RIA0_9STRA|nr:hypothetical protein PF003_g37245 [Phytophthora fragariae]KAE9334374.1 hypothetical protein PF008_g13992 [Phytophthora fragariae]